MKGKGPANYVPMHSSHHKTVMPGNVSSRAKHYTSGPLRRVMRPLQLAWEQRQLFVELTRREIVRRYRGSMLGMLWLVIAPLLMLAVYSFVFGIVFKVRWGGVGENPAMFAAVLFCGVSVFTLFSEVLNRSPILIIENANYVTKVVFPLEILSYVAVAAATANFLLALGVLLIFVAISIGGLPLTLIMVPLLLIPYILMLVGLSWFVAALGVYLRDVAQVTGFISTALIFLSPVFYPVSAIPEAYRFVLLLNPMAYIVEAFRGVLIFGQWPDWKALAVYWIASAVVLVGGYAWFRKLRRGFADVL